MQKEIDQFLARSDDGEHEVTIIVYQNFIDAGTREDPNAVTPGLKEVRTSDGFACNFKGNDTYEIGNDPCHPVIVKRVGQVGS